VEGVHFSETLAERLNTTVAANRKTDDKILLGNLLLN
jgi:hypothetical protein